MRPFRLSHRAEGDLYRIGRYTLRRWGPSQAARCIRELDGCCQVLADDPALGRLRDNIRPGLRRTQQGKRAGFYREEPGAVFISRILHGRLLAERQVIEDHDDSNSSER